MGGYGDGVLWKYCTSLVLSCPARDGRPCEADSMHALGKEDAYIDATSSMLQSIHLCIPQGRHSRF